MAMYKCCEISNVLTEKLGFYKGKDLDSEENPNTVIHKTWKHKE